MITLANFTQHGIEQLQEIERDNNQRLREDVLRAETQLEMAKNALEQSNLQLRMLAQEQTRRQG